jgi:PKD repeat protein
LLNSGLTEIINAPINVANSIPRLQFGNDSVLISVIEGAPAETASVVIDTSDGAVSSFQLFIATSSPWLSLSSNSGQTPSTVLLTADPAISGIGTFTATIDVVDPSGTYDTDSLNIQFIVNSDLFTLLNSPFQNRQQANDLTGQQVSGDMHVFVQPETGVSRVEFFLDGTTGSPTQVEGVSPYDFAGTNPDDTARSFSSLLLPDGSHSITGFITLESGVVQVVTSSFDVNNSGGVNVPPIASMLVPECVGLFCQFDASSSSDVDGSITSYLWDFGDGEVSGEVTPLHIYVADGNYLVSLTVADNSGATDTTTQQVSAFSGNQPPTSVFEASCNQLTCDFDGSASTDADGSIVTYSWDFGDGSTPEGAIISFTFNSIGTKIVSLTVTDNEGASSVSSLSVEVFAGNRTPDASFTFICSLLDCLFDASLSTDPDGSIISYSWDFGDGISDAGQNTSHSYSTPETYTVSLVVTDNDGEAGQDQQSIIVSSGTGCAAISSLDCSQIRSTGGLLLSFDGADGGLVDRSGVATGFTMVDPPTFPGNPNPDPDIVGYWPENLFVDTVDGVLRIDTTSGIQHLTNNALDNALGVGLNLPSSKVTVSTKIVNLTNSPAPGGYAQAGLWFGSADNFGRGTSEDDYVKLVVVSPSADQYRLEVLQERDGVRISSQAINIPTGTDSVTLTLVMNPIDRSVEAKYDFGNGEGILDTFVGLPDEWFSFDQAGIDPGVATRSYGGIYATHRNASESQQFYFDDFSITEAPPITGEIGQFEFDRWNVPVPMPTGLAWGPDERLYVTELFGRIHAITLDKVNRVVVEDQIVDTIPISQLGDRLTLGIAIDPASTSENVILWISHSSGSINNGGENSGAITKLIGPDFLVAEDVITGLPRAIANHAVNNIEFGPDGRLYIAAGGNTGAGAANFESTEFGDRSEQPLSAAILVADVNNPTFEGSCATPVGEFGIPSTCDVSVYASGLRNSYDMAWHKNGSLYATDNGLGVVGTVPPDTTAPCTAFGGVPQDNPGGQPDLLQRIELGKYYGHPNPYRDECVFKNGAFQGVSPLPNYQTPMFILGNNRSANGIIEYRGENFYSRLMGQLLVTNFSVGDNITRIKISEDGTQVTASDNLISGFTDPLPITQDTEGALYVGELNANIVSVLEPKIFLPAPVGSWTSNQSAPLQVLDAGGETIGGKLYMVAGKTNTQHLSSVFVYDPVEDSWVSSTPLPGPSVENPALASLDGKLFAFGGSTSPFSGAVNNAAVFDPSTESWTVLPPMTIPRGGAVANPLQGKIYVAGGMGADGASLDSMEVFDPVTNSWSSGVSMQTRRDNPGAAVLDDRLYIFGGRIRNADGSVDDPTLTSMEIFDINTGAWIFGPQMITGRRAMVVGTISGRIQAIGGENPVVSANEEYDPATNSWRSLTPITTPRHGAAAATINGAVYVGGGSTGGSTNTNITESFRY